MTATIQKPANPRLTSGQRVTSGGGGPVHRKKATTANCASSLRDGVNSIASPTTPTANSASIPASIQSGNSPASPSAAITATTTPTPPSTRVGSEWPDSSHGTATMLSRDASVLATGASATTKPKAVAPHKISLSAITVMSLVHSPRAGSAEGDKGQVCKMDSLCRRLL